MTTSSHTIPSSRRPFHTSLCLLALLSPATAQTNLWTGGDSLWLTPGNWSLASAPVAGQEARILNGGTARVGSSVVAGALYLGVDLEHLRFILSRSSTNTVALPMSATYADATD